MLLYTPSLFRKGITMDGMDRRTAIAVGASSIVIPLNARSKFPTLDGKALIEVNLDTRGKQPAHIDFGCDNQIRMSSRDFSRLIDRPLADLRFGVDNQIEIVESPTDSLA